MFIDHARIQISSGAGGDGHVSFRREKYVPNGGPDGGDGGRGGDVIFVVDKGMNTLFFYKHRYAFRAENGEEGGKRRCHGKNGADLILKVPEGTILREEKSGRVVADLSGDNTHQLVLPGGRGGKGNMHYATASMQAPHYAKPGKPALTLNLILELKLVADVGLVGFPNAGKSTFLKAVTNADPKIAPYPFTTIDPNLGVVTLSGGRSFVLADMPGLIEGASGGVGLGHTFLRHIERTRALIHVVDAASFDGRDPVEDVRAINAELAAYHPEILQKPMVIAANKTDAVTGLPENPVKKLQDAFAGKYRVFPISAVTGDGINELLNEVARLLATEAPPAVRYEQEYFPEEELSANELPYTLTHTTEHGGEEIYTVEGPKIERMLGYTNLESEKGFAFLQTFLRTSGIEGELKKAGIQDGDTVKMYGHRFEYYSGGEADE